MYSTADTIVAIATPPGRGGLGVVRLSGPAAAAIAADLVGRTSPLTARRATYARLRPRGAESPGDEVVVTWFEGPASYTGEDVVEISAHGSPVVLAGILRAAMSLGARLAEPGEFTLRAFLHGKRDLVQAEAVADLIDAVTPLQARAAFDQLEGTLTSAIAAIEGTLFDLMARLEASLDFPDEGYHFIALETLTGRLDEVTHQVEALLAGAARGRLIRDGVQVAIVGAPNVGKSSLFNALLNAGRAIVTPIPGTTRDLLTERADLGGLSVTLVDTAGVRQGVDAIEREGVERARASIHVADLVIVVLDRSRELGDDDSEVLRATADRRRLIVANKVDLAPAWAWDQQTGLHEMPVEVSARAGTGLSELTEQVVERLATGEPHRDAPLVTNVRHVHLLDEARVALNRAKHALVDAGTELSEEFLLADLQEAADRLQEITGRRSTDALLEHIFERFCIGK